MRIITIKYVINAEHDFESQERHERDPRLRVCHPAHSIDSPANNTAMAFFRLASRLLENMTTRSNIT
jgi:hypothetical protein